MSTFRSQPFPAAGGAWRVVEGELVPDTANEHGEEYALTSFEVVDEQDAGAGPALDSETQKPQAPARRRRQQKE